MKIEREWGPFWELKSYSMVETWSEWESSDCKQVKLTSWTSTITELVA